MVEEKYISINPPIRIASYKVANSSYNLMMVAPDYILDHPNIQSTRQEVNDAACSILILLDGTRSYSEVITELMESYEGSRDEITSIVDNFFDEIAKTKVFSLLLSNMYTSSAVELNNYETLYPSVVSLELTNQCNMRCRHCYGSFGTSDPAIIPRDKLGFIADSFSAAGVLTVEITGGDPSVYPYTAEAIEHLFKSGILRVALLTNGSYLNEDLYRTILKYKDRIMVQLDVHSMQEEYHDWFTGTKGTLAKVLTNAQHLRKDGIRVAIASTITPKNLGDMGEVSNWAAEIGAIKYRPSLVVRLGRGASFNNEQNLLFSTPKELERFEVNRREISKTHPSLLDIRDASDSELASKINCGVLSSHCCISSNGDVKLCTMDTGDYFPFSLGNICNETLTEIYLSHKNLIRDISNISKPKQDTLDCADCEKRLFCSGCILRGLLSFNELNSKCRWGQSLPNSIKAHFVNKVSTQA